MNDTIRYLTIVTTFICITLNFLSFIVHDLNFRALMLGEIMLIRVNRTGAIRGELVHA